ncbi:MAG: hypothetical protein ACXW61_13725 [Gemmatirosa sp.]
MRALRLLPLATLALAGACADAATRDGAAPRDASAGAPPAIDPARSAVRAAPTTMIQVTPGTVEAGKQFVVRFAIRNDTPDTTRYTLSCNGAATLALRAADAAADSEPIASSACAQVVTTHAVPPGAELVLQLPSVAASGNPQRPLPPGAYVVTATPTLTEVDGAPFTLKPITAELRIR